MKYDYLWYKSVDNKIIFFLNNSLWTTYHPYVVELISHIAIYFSTISIFLSLKVQVMPVHIYKRPRLEWQQVLCVCVCTSKNTLQISFSQVKICTNIDLHKNQNSKCEPSECGRYLQCASKCVENTGCVYIITSLPITLHLMRLLSESLSPSQWSTWAITSIIWTYIYAPEWYGVESVY